MANLSGKERVVVLAVTSVVIFYIWWCGGLVSVVARWKACFSSQQTSKSPYVYRGDRVVYRLADYVLEEEEEEKRKSGLEEEERVHGAPGPSEGAKTLQFHQMRPGQNSRELTRRIRVTNKSKRPIREDNPL